MEVVEMRRRTRAPWWATLKSLDLSGLDVMADLDPQMRTWDPREDR
jgi:hypothetical protein